MCNGLFFKSLMDLLCLKTKQTWPKRPIYKQEGLNIMLSTHTYRSVFAGTALAIAGGGAFAAEPLAQKDEFATMSRGICAYHKRPSSSFAQLEACQEYVWSQRDNLTHEDKAAGIDAICERRHRKSLDNYQSCKNDLYKTYRVAVAPVTPTLVSTRPSKTEAANANSEDEANHLAACAEGVAISVGAVATVHVAAAVLDVLGCMGLCSAFAWASTPTALGAGTVGCAGGMIREQVRVNKKTALQYPPSIVVN